MPPMLVTILSLRTVFNEFVFSLFPLIWLLLAAPVSVLFAVIKRFESRNDRNCALD
jgi:hypothetical protein